MHNKNHYNQYIKVSLCRKNLYMHDAIRLKLVRLQAITTLIFVGIIFYIKKRY
ncbi:hypothetical protein HMPREF0880_02473 [Yokenella regensburgei ATCC 43003]|nr:hypothetical protein HMPREF0880_02473 [Yokenella regensburgei ATCC 43003]